MNNDGMPPLSYRISADYGTVQIANTNDLFGSTVNVCTKINHMAKPDGMVIGGDLYRIVNSFKNYHFTEVSNCKIDKKFRHPVYAVQRVDNRAALIAHISPGTSKKDQPRVMLVDDEDDVLTVYRMFLSNCGYSVETFNDAEQALVDLQSQSSNMP